MYIPLNEEPFIFQQDKNLDLVITVDKLSTNTVNMTLVGRLDFKTQDVFRRKFLEILEENEKGIDIELHLNGCKHIDSAGFGALLYLHRQVENKQHQLILCELNSSLKTLFTENQLINIFNIR